MLDVNGSVLQPGDYVVYATNTLDRPGLKFGRILKITETDKAKVQGIKDWARLPDAPGYLQHSLRVLKVPLEMVPEHMREELKKLYP